MALSFDRIASISLIINDQNCRFKCRDGIEKLQNITKFLLVIYKDLIDFFCKSISSILLNTIINQLYFINMFYRHFQSRNLYNLTHEAVGSRRSSSACRPAPIYPIQIQTRCYSCTQEPVENNFYSIFNFSTKA